MTEQRPNQLSDIMLEAALAWHDALEQTAASLQTWADFTAWLEADPVHALAFDRVEDMHAALTAVAPQLLPLLPLDMAHQGQERPARAPWLSWLAGGAVAGAAAVVAVLLHQPAPAPSVSTAVFEAPPRHLRAVTLADGSQVDLSPGSRISARMDRVSRQLTLVLGEAAFTVAHDPRPLSLRAADLQIRDIGTEFDVAVQPSRVTVTVVSGVVAVSSSGQDAAPPVRLSAGQQLVHDRAGVQDHVNAANPQAVLSWRSGFLTYRDAALTDIVADLDRNFATHVTVSDAATGARRFSGVLKVDTIGGTLNRLSALLNLSVVRHGDAVELAGSGAHP